MAHKLSFTGERRRRRPDEGERHRAARCPASPEFPPTCGRESGEQERQRHMSSEPAGSNQEEEEDALQRQTQHQSVT